MRFHINATMDIIWDMVFEHEKRQILSNPVFLYNYCLLLYNEKNSIRYSIIIHCIAYFGLCDVHFIAD